MSACSKSGGDSGAGGGGWPTHLSTPCCRAAPSVENISCTSRVLVGCFIGAGAPTKAESSREIAAAPPWAGDMLLVATGDMPQLPWPRGGLRRW